MKLRFEEALKLGYESLEETYPADPVAHCQVCSWWADCDKWWRETDHLSLVAGISRLHRRELGAEGVETVVELSKLPLPIPFTPSRGSASTYERVREQARVQVKSRGQRKPVYELISPPPDEGETPFGLGRLPLPSSGDVFLDLEGDSFASNGGREYLFGLVTIEEGQGEEYKCWWASNPAEERRAFEDVVDFLKERLEAFPAMNVYHYAPYEVTSLKRLMGRYATKMEEIDWLLRAERFIDLHSIVRQSVRVGVERYSIKNLEPLYGFERDANLIEAAKALRRIEQALELRRPSLMTPEIKRLAEQYNRDDCVSTRRLRDWLESLREAEAPRPELKSGDASEELEERLAELEAVRAGLLEGVPDDPDERTQEQQARYQLAFLLDWHRREEKAAYWELFRLRGLPEDEMLEETKAFAYLAFQGVVNNLGRSVVERYRYPDQEVELQEGDKLRIPGENGSSYGTIYAHDRANSLVDVKIGNKSAGKSPSTLFSCDVIGTDPMKEVLLNLGRQAADAGGVNNLPEGPQRALLLRETPRLADGEDFHPPAKHAELSVSEYAVEIVTNLDRTALVIQGPPGAGKTFTGARMIVGAVRAGLKVGVTATSHKVIRNFLKKVSEEADR